MQRLILASGSPRRAELLKQIGLPFEVVVSDLNEEQFFSPISPAEMVKDLAFQKARAVAKTITEGVILGADTVVVIDGEVLGKPMDSFEAKSMLTKLCGKGHSVFTGLALIKVPQQHYQVSFVETGVKFRSLSEPEIDAYVATGEPLDKAGAYGIQGKGAVLVEEIQGCYFNIVGLPIAKLVMMLQEFGIAVL